VKIVEDSSNEITAALQLLKTPPLAGVIITGAAIFTRRRSAARSLTAAKTKALMALVVGIGYRGLL